MTRKNYELIAAVLYRVIWFTLLGTYLYYTGYIHGSQCVTLQNTANHVQYSLKYQLTPAMQGSVAFRALQSTERPENAQSAYAVLQVGYIDDGTAVDVQPASGYSVIQ